MGVANKESYLQIWFHFLATNPSCDMAFYPEWSHLGVEPQPSAKEADTVTMYTYYWLINPHNSLSCDKYKKDVSKLSLQLPDTHINQI